LYGEQNAAPVTFKISKSAMDGVLNLALYETATGKEREEGKGNVGIIHIHSSLVLNLLNVFQFKRWKLRIYVCHGLYYNG
jgi:hypothetical protein